MTRPKSALGHGLCQELTDCVTNRKVLEVTDCVTNLGLVHQPLVLRLIELAIRLERFLRGPEVQLAQDIHPHADDEEEAACSWDLYM